MGSQDISTDRAPVFAVPFSREPQRLPPPAEPAKISLGAEVFEWAATPVTPTGAAWSDTLIAGEVLLAGQQLECGSQEYSTLMRGDGNLVIYRNGDWSQLWASGTGGHREGFLAVRDDGDVSVCGVDGRPVWSAGTSGNPGAFVQLHGDGRLAVYSFYRDLLWSSAPPF